jgi:hypothetical protein
MYLQKVISKKTCILKINDENSRIQSRSRIRYSEVRIRPTCHGSETLVKREEEKKERKEKMTKRKEDKRKLAHQEEVAPRRGSWQ